MSVRFLESILLDEPYRSAIHSRIEIVGAHFSEPLDFSDRVFANSLLLDEGNFDAPVHFERVDIRGLSFARARFNAAVSFTDAKVGGSISLDHAVIGSLDLGGIDVKDAVYLDGIKPVGADGATRSRPPGDIALFDARIGLDLSTIGARVGSISAERVTVHGEVRLSNGDFGEIRFPGARIGGNLDLVGARAKNLNLADIEAKSIFMRRDRDNHGSFVHRIPMFGNVTLAGAHLSSGLDLDGATVADVNAAIADIGENASLSNAKLGHLDFGSAHVGGDLSLSESTAKGVDFTSITVDKALYAINVTQASSPKSQKLKNLGSVDVSSSHLGQLILTKVATDAIDGQAVVVDGDVIIREASIDSLDLSSAKIEGDLFLIARNAPIWRGRHGLVLRNASVHAVEDHDRNCTEFGSECIDPWPIGCSSTESSPSKRCSEMDLSGFSYKTFGILPRSKDLTKPGTNGPAPKQHTRAGMMGDRDLVWWKEWLARMPYSPQPYDQLASVLRSSGRPDDATEIQFAGKDREFETATFSTKGFLIVDRWLVGYGYHPWYALGWAALLIVGGIVAVWRSGYKDRLARAGEPIFVSALVYSFDALIPLVTLRKTDAEIELAGWAQYYFYGQKIAGYVLATFLVAGISGLTK